MEKKRGRPPEYKPEYAEQAFKFCLLAKADDTLLAQFFDVSEQTINNWKLKYPLFLESLQRGKEKADAEVAQSLYKRALGYSYQEVRTATGQGGHEITTTTTKEVPPDTAAAFIWLKNRQKNKWRDKTEHQTTVTHRLEELSDNDLENIAASSSERTSQKKKITQQPDRIH